jgi:Domain of unknown function (DUF5753)
VIPFTVTSCALFGSSTTHVISFASSRLPTVAWQETVTAWGIIDDPRQVRDIDIAYDETLRLTLNPQESLVMIKDRIGELA